MRKVYKFYSYTKKHGIGTAIKKTAVYIAKKLKITKQSIDIMVDIEDVIEADFYNNPYVKPSPIVKDKVNIAWVLSPVSPGSGGQSTIIRFARFLQEKGHTITVYIYEGIHPQSVEDAKDILKKNFKIDVNVKKISAYTDADVLIATGWETAYPVFNMKTNAHKFYFVQDYEPLFYGVGSKTVLAENTYKMGLYGITAGRWLAHKLSTQFNMPVDYFDFGVDVDTYRPKDVEKMTKKKKIVFYARPVTERRAFELGIITLGIFHEKHPDYTIEFIGWDVSDFKIPFPYVNRGILSHDELAELYQESAACLVLSLTNVSLLPLELLAAGCIPVVNEGENNTMVLGENKYITYAAAVPGQLANALSNVVEARDVDQIAREASNSVRASSWQPSYEKVEAIIKREITKGSV